nr:protein disulfide-isomerase-like [Ipomoea batatas]
MRSWGVNCANGLGLSLAQEIKLIELGVAAANLGQLEKNGWSRCLNKAPLVLGQTNDGEKYLKPNVEPDQIATWVKDFKDGKLKPFLSSEPIPENNSEPMKVIVTDSLEEMDATANDIPKGKFEVKGFPTLYFKSASAIAYGEAPEGKYASLMMEMMLAFCLCYSIEMFETSELL